MSIHTGNSQREGEESQLEGRHGRLSGVARGSDPCLRGGWPHASQSEHVFAGCTQRVQAVDLIGGETEE